MKSGRRKTVYILAALIVLAAGVALVGGTLANPDRVNRGEGQAESTLPPSSGEYSIVISAYAGTEKADYNYSEIKENSCFANALWCPGRTEIVYIEVKNNEAFVIEYSPILAVSEAVNGSVKFYDAFSYAAHPGMKPENMNSENWAELIGAVKYKGELKDGKNYLYSTGSEQEMIPVQSGKKSYFAIALHMDENTPDAYQKGSMKLNINLKVDADYKPGYQFDTAGMNK